MDGLLVSYANAAADVAGHVAFGVDPPALADFFSAVVFRVRFESVQLPNRAAPPPLGKRLHFRDEAARTVTPHSTIRGRTGAVQDGITKKQWWRTKASTALPYRKPCSQGRPSLTDCVTWDAVS
ncbi:hypothetical protein NFI96_009920 [Prochilodus magdalenae]|nr:hypothetical protein NFI96_009920 [Prochilodus magdalenae]